LFVGSGAFLDANSLRFASDPRVKVRQLRFSPSGWKQKLHYAWFCLWCFAWAVCWRPQWVYASDLLACPPALLLSCVLSLRLIYHEHDSPGRATSMFIRLCMKARQGCARRASVCVLPNAQRARLFVEETQAKNLVQVVWNCPELREASAINKGKAVTGLRVLYHGSITPERIPSTIIQALAFLPKDVSLTLVGYETVGSQGYTQALLARAEQLGVRERVHCLGPLNRIDLLETCVTCHVGLALLPLTNDDTNLRAMTGASNKPFDYLACGLAVLVSDLPDWREMFVEPGYGLCCDPEEPVSVAAALRRFYEFPAERRLMGERGRKQILAEWNYETQFQPVLKELKTS